MVSVESIFYCRDCTLAVVDAPDGPVQCQKCNKEITIIGWMESGKDKGTEEQKD